MNKNNFAALLIAFISIFIFVSSYSTLIYTVIYNGNGYTGGTVPVATEEYKTGETRVLSHKITFIGNGGTGIMAALKGEEGEKIKLLPNTFTWEGFLFDGWGIGVRRKPRIKNKPHLSL